MSTSLKSPSSIPVIRSPKHRTPSKSPSQQFVLDCTLTSPWSPHSFQVGTPPLDTPQSPACSLQSFSSCYFEPQRPLTPTSPICGPPLSPYRQALLRVHGILDLPIAIPAFSRSSFECHPDGQLPFLRAYSNDLAIAGVAPHVFLEFIDHLNEYRQSRRRGSESSQTWDYLDQMNASVFHPHSLEVSICSTRQLNQVCNTHSLVNFGGREAQYESLMAPYGGFIASLDLVLPDIPMSRPPSTSSTDGLFKKSPRLSKLFSRRRSAEEASISATLERAQGHTHRRVQSSSSPQAIEWLVIQNWS